MFDPRSGIKFFTLDEANAILPQVRRQLVQLREKRRRIVRQQAEVDIEELTAVESVPQRGKVEELLRAIQADVRSFHGMLEEFQSLGCELKDLDRGLVDFYSMRGNDVVYLCWMDSEGDIEWWHPLNTGVKGRLPL